jgi:hypothetical protein
MRGSPSSPFFSFHLVQTFFGLLLSISDGQPTHDIDHITSVVIHQALGNKPLLN